MLVLGFDSAGDGASVALLRDGAVIATRDATQARGQAEILMPMIAQVLDEGGIAASGLDLIGVGVGPGSFTGLRIAIAAARGLALATGVPAIGVTAFAAIAAQVPMAQRDGRALLVAIDTRRDDFYLQLFASDAGSDPIAVGAAAVAAWVPPVPLLLAGDAAHRLAPALAGRDLAMGAAVRVEGADVARLAAAAYRPGLAVAPPQPLYLRPPDTTLPRGNPA
ncbi:MAG TPA: tRNA (adenosine(37)-N6)-threonylcarbamoyltransferase complex dimerization subunit type 1 TsaB [Stellaceae bacterium]